MPRSAGRRVAPIGESVISVIRKAAAAVCLSSVIVGGIAACGTVEQLSAADKVNSSFKGLGDSKSLTIRVDVDATAGDLRAFGKAVKEPIEDDVAKALSGLTFAVSLSSDKPLKDVKALTEPESLTGSKALGADLGVDIAYELADADGKPVVEFRQVGGTSYAHLDIDGVAALLGENPQEARDGLKDAPPEMAFAKDIVDGKWVSLDTKILSDMVEKATEAKGGGSEPSPLPSLDAKDQKKLFGAIGDVLNRNVTFTDKGKVDGADHIAVSTPARRLAEDVQKTIFPIVKGIPAFKDAAGDLPTGKPTDVPDRNITADVYIKDGTVSKLSLDFAQFDDSAKGVRLPISILFEKKDVKIEAPTGATVITEENLNSVMGMAFGGTGSGSSGFGSAPAL